MSGHLSIKVDWASLAEGSPEECAGFAALGIFADGTCLTTRHDSLLESVRETPCLSAYHLAEWLAWNWWRLRWEPSRSTLEWELSHAMASIGGGYIWPNIRIVPDGKTTTLVCKPTPKRACTPYRYINEGVSVIPAVEFENEVDQFIAAVLQRLEDRHVSESNLRDIWRSVIEERSDPSMCRRRRLEALLGEDPGEMDSAVLHQLLSEGDATGEAALEEIAANRMPGQGMPDIGQLLAAGRELGVAANPQDQVSLRIRIPHDLAAWKVGARAARLLRKQEGIEPDQPVRDEQLARMYGVPDKIFDEPNRPTPRLDMSFALSEVNRHDRIVLRSPWKNSRRFELARLLGDALIHPTDDSMRPATRSDTYRQKAQRAFAAELLSPIDAVKGMLGGDYSMESQQDVAHHFNVYDMVIRTLLVNHDVIDRDELGDGSDRRVLEAAY